MLFALPTSTKVSADPSHHERSAPTDPRDLLATPVGVHHAINRIAKLKVRRAHRASRRIRYRQHPCHLHLAPFFHPDDEASWSVSETTCGRRAVKHMAIESIRICWAASSCGNTGFRRSITTVGSKAESNMKICQTIYTVMQIFGLE